MIIKRNKKKHHLQSNHVFDHYNIYNIFKYYILKTYKATVKRLNLSSHELVKIYKKSYKKF